MSTATNRGRWSAFSNPWKNGRGIFQSLEIPATALLLVALLGSAACNRRTAPTPPAEPTGPLNLTAVLSTNAVRVGDIVQLTLTADHPRDARLQIPDFSNGKDIVLRDQKTRTQGLPDGKARTIAQFRLTSFTVGTHTVCTGSVECVQKDGQIIRQRFPVTAFQVRSVLSQPTEAMRDIKGPVRWPGVFPRWLIGLALVAALAVATAILLSRFLSKPRTFLTYPPPPLPHDVALSALRDLIGKGWIEQENVEPFYVELSSIVRRYLEDRFNLRAPERTTEEFIREAASSRRLVAEHQRLTEDFLEQSDLVKFARHRPGQPEMKAAYGSAERLVKETIPPPAAPAAGNPESGTEGTAS